MLPRATQRLETTLLLSRQALPRPARLYSTPSKKVNAPALATVHAPQPQYPPFAPPPSQFYVHQTNVEHDPITQFLGRKIQYTVLPTPAPASVASENNYIWYTDSVTHETIAVMDACLHNLYDVPRAKKIFDDLRQHPRNALIEVRTFNAFLEAYLGMAENVTHQEEKEYWISSMWELFDFMERGDWVTPNASSYATMLQAYNRFSALAHSSLEVEGAQSYAQLLRAMVEREIPATKVIADRVFTSPDEAQEIIKELSAAAVKFNLTSVLKELGEADALGRGELDILKDVPEAMPVMRPKRDATEGEINEKEIPFNLDVLRRHLAEVTLSRRVLPDDVIARQKVLEDSVFEVAIERMKRQAEVADKLGLPSGALRRPVLQRWMWEWHTALVARLEDVMKEINLTEKKKRPVLGPYLSLVKAERLSILTIMELMRLQGSGGISDGMKTARALIAVGKAVEIEYKAQMCRRNKIQVPSTATRGGVQFFTNLGYSSLHERRVVAAKHMEDAETWTASWSPAIRSRVGGILVESLMEVAKVSRTMTDPKTGEIVTEEQPAFYHTYEYQRGQKLGVIRFNPVVMERLAKDPLKYAVHPRHLPMLVKPKPWLSHDQGGYLHTKTHVMRFKDSLEQQLYLKKACEQGNLELVFAALDVLGSTPWKINRNVFDVVLKVWNSGERMGKIPPAVYDHPEPPIPEKEVDMKAKVIQIQKLRSYMQAKANNHSERCSVNYKVEIARSFLGDEFYLPHNLDFRGRAYPVPPHLSHLGDDLSRGLLTFAEAKPLGERGLRWLKIHLANLYGYDKASFDERVEWVMERLDDIYDSATNPLEGRRWWTNAGDPWQCLATCFELHAALESPNPLEFMSSLPVHQDGTCNGLQHYAALGGDAQGAQQVNLAASERPSDVYSYVGRMTEELLKQDAKKGNEMAILLDGKITRKVVKQTVMTTVYGVTYVGAREQIEKQLKDRKDIPEELCWGAASYLARVVLICIGDLFKGAKGIQTWLNLCARIISRAIPEERLKDAMGLRGSASKKPVSNKKAGWSRIKKEQMTSVIWTTPLGLPIVQPYRKLLRKQVTTSVQTVYIADPNTPAEVNSIKQASAFPPNFIHSLDATHMMLTALECQTQGLAFASVHDSYWTHACSIDKMSEVIRDTFIALHSSDVLKKLEEEFKERYKDYKIPLVSFRSGHFTKNLYDAGTRLTCTPEQAKKLESISPLLVISDSAESSIEEADTSSVDQNQMKELLADLSRKSSDKYQFEDDEDGDDYLATDPKSAAKREAEEKAIKELLGKFVNVADLIPPLPEKGTFRVEDIKKSEYFFS